MVIQVYGHADHSRSAEFLGELQAKVLEVSAAQTPLMVGDDFNLIRSGADKNNDYINWSRVAMFNNAIASMSITPRIQLSIFITPTLAFSGDAI